MGRIRSKATQPLRANLELLTKSLVRGGEEGKLQEKRRLSASSHTFYHPF